MCGCAPETCRCLNMLASIQLFVNIRLNMPPNKECLCIPSSLGFGFIVCIVHVVFLWCFRSTASSLTIITFMDGTRFYSLSHLLCARLVEWVDLIQLKCHNRLACLTGTIPTGRGRYSVVGPLWRPIGMKHQRERRMTNKGEAERKSEWENNQLK